MTLVAKVERLDATSRYRLLPESRPVLAGPTSMMGRAGSLRTVATFSDYRGNEKLGQIKSLFTGIY